MRLTARVTRLERRASSLAGQPAPIMAPTNSDPHHIAAVLAVLTEVAPTVAGLEQALQALAAGDLAPLCAWRAAQ